MPDYREEVFKMLNIKPYQTFTLYNTEKKDKTDITYYFDNELNLMINGYHRSDNDLVMLDSHSRSDINLADIITNKYRIIKKIEFTDKELAAINYAKAIGCKWFAKDENGSVWAFIDKPVKSKKFDWWEYADDSINQESYEIKIPLSFLHWEDEEPYEI